MSLKRNNKGRFLPDKKFAQDLDHQYIISEYNNGKSSRAIAIELNSYPKKIQKILKSNGIEFRKKQCYLSGEDNPRYTGHKEMQGAYLATLKASAKNRGIEFSVTYEYIWNLFLEQDRKFSTFASLIGLMKKIHKDILVSYEPAVDLWYTKDKKPLITFDFYYKESSGKKSFDFGDDLPF